MLSSDDCQFALPHKSPSFNCVAVPDKRKFVPLLSVSFCLGVKIDTNGVFSSTTWIFINACEEIPELLVAVRVMLWLPIISESTGSDVPVPSVPSMSEVQTKELSDK